MYADIYLLILGILILVSVLSFRIELTFGTLARVFKLKALHNLKVVHSNSI